MQEEMNFRKGLNHFINDFDSYTKEELYNVFLEMTERYLDEMINTMNYEHIILSQLGDEKGSEVIEMAATSNPAIDELENKIITEDDPKKRIKDRMDYIDSEFKRKYDAEGGPLPELPE